MFIELGEPLHWIILLFMFLAIGVMIGIMIGSSSEKNNKKAN